MTEPTRLSGLPIWSRSPARSADVSDVARVEFIEAIRAAAIKLRTEPMYPVPDRAADVPTILAIDPGTVQSAWVLFAGGRPVAFGIWPNADLLDALRSGAPTGTAVDGQLVEPSVAVIEQVASYGMPVGAEVFETVRWAGRFEEALYPTPVVLLPRMAVKMHLCGNSRAKDANIRRALLDRFGGPTFDPKVAVGTKKAPGPLYGIHADLWAALAIAVTFAETRP